MNGSARQQRWSSSSNFSCSCSAIRPSFRLIRIRLRQRIVESRIQRRIGIGFSYFKGADDFFGDAFFESGLLLVGEKALFAEACFVEGDRVAELGLFGLFLG